MKYYLTIILLLTFISNISSNEELDILWENFEEEFTSSKTKKYGVIDPLTLITSKDKESLYSELKNLKTKSEISIYLFVSSFKSDIKSVSEYLKDKLKVLYDNNENSLLAVINTDTNDIIILGGSGLNKKITKQVIENMTKTRKEKLPEKKYYFIFRDIILDVIYYVGDIDDPYFNEDDNVFDQYDENDDYWQKQYEDDEDRERTDDETKEDKRKSEKINGDEYVEVDQDKINENGYDYWKDNDDYNNDNNNNNKDKENKKEKEEKKIETNKKGNGLYIFIIFLLFFVLSVIVYLYLSMKKKIKLLNSRAIDYNDIKMETKYFPPTISSNN